MGMSVFAGILLKVVKYLVLFSRQQLLIKIEHCLWECNFFTSCMHILPWRVRPEYTPPRGRGYK